MNTIGTRAPAGAFRKLQDRNAALEVEPTASEKIGKTVSSPRASRWYVPPSIHQNTGSAAKLDTTMKLIGAMVRDYAHCRASSATGVVIDKDLVTAGHDPEAVDTFWPAVQPLGEAWFDHLQSEKGPE